MKLAVLLNADGGTFRTIDLEDFGHQVSRHLARAGHSVDLIVKPGAAIRPALERCVRRDDLDALVIGGGDGTISTAAAIAFKGGMPLGIAPGGTMNLFARSLGVPMDPLEAITALADGRMGAVDIATVNGMPFVHQFSVGLHARLVRMRNAQVFGSRMGKMAATLKALGGVIVDPPRFPVAIDTGSGHEHHIVSAISVGNNTFSFSPVPVSETLDAGILGLYIAEAMVPRDVLTLTLDAIRGRLKANPGVTARTTHAIHLRFPQLRRGARAVVDGELIALQKDMELEIHPRGLPVFIPATLRYATAVANDDTRRGTVQGSASVFQQEGKTA